jgi:hypothetical protein
VSGLVFGVVVTSVLIACSGDPADASISPETACNDAAKALCEKLQTCAPFLSTLLFVDQDSCVARTKTNCESSFGAPGTSATPKRASECARDVKKSSCEDLLGRTLPETCRTLPGDLDDGKVCGHDAQCKNKLCRIPSGAACGACSALGEAGDACARVEDCDYGLTCAGQKCVAHAKAGNACSAAQPCLPTLACTGGVCAAPLAAGAACTFKIGENPCDAAKGLYCHPKQNLCVAFGTAPAGGQCGLGHDPVTVCTGSSECSGLTTGSCMAPAADGASCNDTTGPRCVTPARCTNGVCTITDPATCK